MKKIIALLIALTMISSFLPTVAMAADEAPEVIIRVTREYNFDDVPGPDSWVTADLGGDRGKVMRHPEAEVSLFSDSSSTSLTKNGATAIIDTMIGIIPDEEGNTWEGTGGITFFYFGNTKSSGFSRNSSGNFTFMGTSTGVPMEIGKWYHVVIKMRQAPAKSHLLIEDEEGTVIVDYEKTSIYSNFYRASFSASSQGHVYTTDDNLTFYDDFRLYYTGKPYQFTAAAYDRNGTETSFEEVDYIDPSFQINFTEKMKSTEEVVGTDPEGNGIIEADLTATMKIYDEENNEVPFTSSLDTETRKILTITPTAGLVAKANYRLVVEGALTAIGTKGWAEGGDIEVFEIPFTVSKKDLSIESVESAPAGDTISYDVTIRNKTGENQEAYIVIARYDGEKCVAVTTCPVTGAEDGVVYPDITLDNLGTEDAIILISADGTFRAQDIWGK